MSTKAELHFDAIAEEYDYWKEKNSYYYDNLKRLCQSLIPLGSSVAEIGCGTGDILASLKVSRGFGIDISHAMIERAREKHRARIELSFSSLDITKHAPDLS